MNQQVHPPQNVVRLDDLRAWRLGDEVRSRQATVAAVRKRLSQEGAGLCPVCFIGVSIDPLGNVRHLVVGVHPEEVGPLISGILDLIEKLHRFEKGEEFAPFDHGVTAT